MDGVVLQKSHFFASFLAIFPFLNCLWLGTTLGTGTSSDSTLDSDTPCKGY